MINEPANFCDEAHREHIFSKLEEEILQQRQVIMSAAYENKRLREALEKIAYWRTFAGAPNLRQTISNVSTIALDALEFEISNDKAELNVPDDAIQAKSPDQELYVPQQKDLNDA